MVRQDGVKHALFGTLPGRAIVIGLAIKLVVWLVRVALGAQVAFLSVVDTVAGLAIAVGAIYFVIRLLVLAKRRLLWRVRRKLILSYIFIGFVPAILIVAFFLLFGLLLFYNVSSYLVQSRLREMEGNAKLLAQSVADEIQPGGGRDVAGIIERKQATAAAMSSGASIALVAVNRPCAQTSTVGEQRDPKTSSPEPGRIDKLRPPTTAGPWRHVEPPNTLPPWIGCDGFTGLLAYQHSSGLPGGQSAERPGSITLDGQRVELEGSGQDTHMFVRAAAFPNAAASDYAVIVDLPVNDEVKQRLLRETGVEIRSLSAVPLRGRPDARPLAGRDGGDRPQQTSSSGGSLSWIAFLEYRDWNSGGIGTLLVSTQLSIGEIYDRIAAAQGSIGNRSFGPTLLFVLLVIVGGLFLIIEFVALVVGLALAKSITGSVHALFTGTERVRQGDFTHKIAVKAQDQLGELAGSFNQMTASIEDLLRQAAEKKRLEEELRIAREIQMSLLPQGPLAMPGLSMTALCVPAREVGGDYYDFLPLDDHRLGILIADVSGKGTSAALYMAELKGLVLSLSRIHTSPRELMIAANRIIANNLDNRSFITMTYAVIDLQERMMTYARAGHTPLIYVPGPAADSRRARILAPDGMVVGLKLDNGEMFDRLLEEETIPLNSGDLYLFFTDGITEAMNAGDDCFGEARLGRVVEEHAHLPSDELRERVLREIAAFVGDAPQHDDMTMIVLKVDEVVIPKIVAENAVTAPA